MYGGGATLAFGGKGWFATLTYDLTETDLDVATSSVSAWVVTWSVACVCSSKAGETPICAATCGSAKGRARAGSAPGASCN